MGTGNLLEGVECLVEGRLRRLPLPHGGAHVAEDVSDIASNAPVTVAVPLTVETAPVVTGTVPVSTQAAITTPPVTTGAVNAAAGVASWRTGHGHDDPESTALPALHQQYRRFGPHGAGQLR